MKANTRRRRGVTLMEVMIATGILVVGMVAIMALFPIGAINFARALNQDRSATHGVNSEAMFAYYWKKAWVELDPVTGAPTGNLCASTEDAYYNSQEPMLLMLEFHPAYAPNGIQLVSSQPSFPVLVDPVGWQTNAGNLANQGFVAGNPAFPVRTTLRRAIRLTPPGSPTLPADYPYDMPRPSWVVKQQPFNPTIHT